MSRLLDCSVISLACQDDPDQTASDLPAAQPGLPGEVSQLLDGVGGVAAAHRLRRLVEGGRVVENYIPLSRQSSEKGH